MVFRAKFTILTLALAGLIVVASSKLRRKDSITRLRATGGPTLADGPVKVANDNRLHLVKHIGEIAEDLETRFKPPFISIPGQEQTDRLTKQQASGLKGIFDSRPEDFRECVLIHQYAEPLQVIDSLSSLERHAVEIEDEAAADPKETDTVIMRPGAIYDDTTDDGSQMHIGTSMFANLEGMSNPVQVMAQGAVAQWGSKWRVPIAGFLCTMADKSDSAPVLHATPTPCVPTTLDAQGNALDPLLDGFEVFVGTTRLSFKDKAEAEKFCIGYAREIAFDIGTQVWDAESLKQAKPDRRRGDTGPLALISPSLPSFIEATRVRQSPEGWTKGIKRLLVVIMDWKEGDDSMEPFSSQQPDAVAIYRDKIFPEANRIFKSMSWGQFGFEATFVPEVVRFTRNRDQISGRWPFPALYHEARLVLEGHESHSEQFPFRNFDLVFVLHPQVKPLGTKGVAWVGSRGAACNGCETADDSLKVMVAVHELGHNLGLSHASSEELEYGNPFDWMGNYPNVVGLHFGLGYMYQMGWVTDANIFQITDESLLAVNDRIIVKPFDGTHRPNAGDVVGVRISLSSNPNDLYLSYRANVNADKKGLYVVYQDKESPNSKLVDTACHSISQQDAHMREGWTFMDSSNQVVVVLEKQTAEAVTVHIFSVPAGVDSVPAIRARPGFTDGHSKCPVTCQDADLLFSKTCDELKPHCAKGFLKTRGKKLSIGLELCPQTCGRCDEVLSSTPLEKQKAGCVDQQVDISGLNCAALAQQDACGAKTTAGVHIGRDLCPRSCGLCAVDPPAAGKQPLQLANPEPARTVGFGAVGSLAAKVAEEAERQQVASAFKANASHFPISIPFTKSTLATTPCEDDPLWVDPDGHGCEHYQNTLQIWSRKRVCEEHHDGLGGLHCRKTCGSCVGETSTEAKPLPEDKCADNACIGPWMQKFGRCYQCKDFSGSCNKPEFREVFHAECPLTCGVCSVPSTTPAPPSVDCADGDQKFCKHLGFPFCADKDVARICPKTCELCTTHVKAESQCHDKFAAYTCSRYESYGWCERDDTRDAVQLHCPLTCGLCGAHPSRSGSPRGMGAFMPTLVLCALAAELGLRVL